MTIIYFKIISIVGINRSPSYRLVFESSVIESSIEIQIVDTNVILKRLPRMLGYCIVLVGLRPYVW
jgi:hypothetical protein